MVHFRLFPISIILFDYNPPMWSIFSGQNPVIGAACLYGQYLVDKTVDHITRPHFIGELKIASGFSNQKSKILLNSPPVYWVSASTLRSRTSSSCRRTEVPSLRVGSARLRAPSSRSKRLWDTKKTLNLWNVCNDKRHYVQGGPSGRGILFVDIKLKVPSINFLY